MAKEARKTVSNLLIELLNLLAKVLRDKRSGKKAKSLAGSVLAQS